MTGERLPDGDVDQIFKLTGIEEDLDGNIKYAGNCKQFAESQKINCFTRATPC